MIAGILPLLRRMHAVTGDQPGPTETEHVMLAILAILFTLLTGHPYQVAPVHGSPAVCAVTVSHGQAYAGDCFR